MKECGCETVCWDSTDKAVPDGKIVARGLPLQEAVEELMDEVKLHLPLLMCDMQCESILCSFLSI